MKASLPLITGPNVELRPPMESDTETRFALGNDPEIHRMFGGSRAQLHPMTVERAERWVRRLMDHPFAWVIVCNGLIGEIRLDRLDRTDRRASLAIGIVDPDALGRGYGTEAARLLLRYAFRDLSLHRVSVRVLAYNTRAIRSYEKCGFVLEGREREAAQVDGEWHDDVIMGVLDREFIDT